MRPIYAEEAIKAIIAERDAIPLKLPPAPYEFGEQPNHHGEAMRGGIRKALRCIAQTPTIDVKKISDGYHTFEDLYEQRLILSATLAKNNPYAWKSKLHDDGTEPFGGGWFIIGFDTPEGEYTYHFELKEWDLFQCKELPNGKPWDGHTSKDVRRLLSMPHKVDVHCSECEYRSQYADDEGYYLCGGLESEGDNIILVLPDFSCDHGERRNNHV